MLFTLMLPELLKTDDGRQYKRTEQNECFAFKSRQANHFLVSDEIELIEDGIMFCKVLVLV